MAIQLKDVAEKAGVSPQVVSAVLNNRSYMRISSERRRKIRAIADELGYRVNLQAKSLRSGHAATVGLFLPDWPDLLLLDLLKGVAAGSSKYNIPCNSSFGLSLASYSKFLDEMTEARHTGIISYVPFGQEDYPQIKAKLENFIAQGGKAVLVMASQRDIAGAVYLNIDHQRGGQLGANYLKTHTKFNDFLLLGFDSPIHQERFKGVFSEIPREQIHALTFRSVDPEPQEQMLATIEERLAQLKPPVAIFSVTNYFTGLIFKCCHQRHWVYNQDYFLISYDQNNRGNDVEKIVRVIQPFAELGTLALSHINAMLCHQKLAQTILSPILQINH